MNGSDVSRIRSELLLEAVAEAGRTSAYAAGTPKLVAQVLAEIPVFAGLSGRQRRRIAEQAEIAEIKAGTSIMREGFTGEAAFVLLTGAARVERAGVPAAEVASGTVIGELSLLTGRPRSATVTATRRRVGAPDQTRNVPAPARAGAGDHRASPRECWPAPLGSRAGDGDETIDETGL